MEWNERYGMLDARDENGVTWFIESKSNGTFAIFYKVSAMSLSEFVGYAESVESAKAKVDEWISNADEWLAR